MAASPITSRFGESVRRLRRRIGISQEALGERADLHRTYITEVESGARNVTLKSMERLARALEVSTAAFLFQAGDPAVRVELANGETSKCDCADILLAEANRNDVELTLWALKRARITNSVQVAYDAREAVDYLFCAGRFSHRKIENAPCVVLLDLNLPENGGMEVIRRMKADPRTASIPVVVLTGSPNELELAECRRLGAETSMMKPVDLPKLIQAAQQMKLDWTLVKAGNKEQHSNEQGVNAGPGRGGL